MGRFLVLTVGLVLAGLVPAAPAGAHACGRVLEVPVGEPTVVTLAVGSEADAITEVGAQVPNGFVVEAVIAHPAWQADRDGDTIRWRGGMVVPFACDYFSLRGTATEATRLVFPITTRTADGRTRELRSTNPGAEDAAQVVFAGISPREGAGTGSSVNPATIAGAAAVTVALIGAGLWASRRRTQAAEAPARRPSPGRNAKRKGRGSSHTRKRKRRRANRR
ncbi:MAG: hypothetical protein ACRD1K_07375 [Acidimicrobiales bacterium]